MMLKRAVVAAVLVCAVIYLKYCLPGFAEEFVPLLHGWLELEQVSIPLPVEVMTWVGWN